VRTLFVHYTDHYPSKFDDKSRSVSVSRPLIIDGRPRLPS